MGISLVGDLHLVSEVDIPLAKSCTQKEENSYSEEMSRHSTCNQADTQPCGQMGGVINKLEPSIHLWKILLYVPCIVQLQDLLQCLQKHYTLDQW